MRPLNCTEVMARYRKGWASYTEVYRCGPAVGAPPSHASNTAGKIGTNCRIFAQNDLVCPQGRRWFANDAKPDQEVCRFGRTVLPRRTSAGTGHPDLLCAERRSR